jgi:membrane protein required for colicin V production
LTLTWIDFVLLGIIGLSTLISIVRGFVKEAISLVVWFSALFISSQFYPDIAVYFTAINDNVLRNSAAIAVLFIITLIIGALVNYVLGQLVKATGLSGTDRALGSAFGLLRGVLIVSAGLFFIDTFTPAAQAFWWQESVLIPEFAIIIEWFFEYVKGSSSFIKPA